MNVQSCAIEVAVPPVAVRVTVGVGTGLSAWMTTVPVFVPAAAVTVALASVVSRVLASPFPSVISRVDESVPAVVLNVTGMPGTGLPPRLTALAMTSTVPPVAGTDPALDRTVTVSTVAAPRRNFTVAVALPEDTVMVASPDVPSPAMNVEVATEFLVCASAGSIRPKLVLNRTLVPF